MEKQPIKKIEKLLAQEKQELLEVEASLQGQGGLGDPMDVTNTELSAYDNHPADYGSQMYERSKDLGLLQVVQQQLAEIAEAQEAIREGTYGYCTNCGQSIPIGRLLAVPRTLLCVQCKRMREDQDLTDRPAEEVLLDPPFGNDTWDAVARYGTSSYTEED